MPEFDNMVDAMRYGQARLTDAPTGPKADSSGGRRQPGGLGKADGHALGVSSGKASPSVAIVSAKDRAAADEVTFAGPLDPSRYPGMTEEGARKVDQLVRSIAAINAAVLTSFDEGKHRTVTREEVEGTITRAKAIFGVNQPQMDQGEVRFFENQMAAMHRVVTTTRRSELDAAALNEGRSPILLMLPTTGHQLGWVTAAPGPSAAMDPSSVQVPDPAAQGQVSPGTGRRSRHGKGSPREAVPATAKAPTELVPMGGGGALKQAAVAGDQKPSSAPLHLVPLVVGASNLSRLSAIAHAYAGLDDRRMIDVQRALERAATTGLAVTDLRFPEVVAYLESVMAANGTALADVISIADGMLRVRLGEATVAELLAELTPADIFELLLAAQIEAGGTTPEAQKALATVVRQALQPEGIDLATLDSRGPVGRFIELLLSAPEFIASGLAQVDGDRLRLKMPPEALAAWEAHHAQYDASHSDAFTATQAAYIEAGTAIQAWTAAVDLPRLESVITAAGMMPPLTEFDSDALAAVAPSALPAVPSGSANAPGLPANRDVRTSPPSQVSAPTSRPRRTPNVTTARIVYILQQSQAGQQWEDRRSSRRRQDAQRWAAIQAHDETQRQRYQEAVAARGQTRLWERRLSMTVALGQTTAVPGGMSVRAVAIDPLGRARDEKRVPPVTRS